jgi:hypothetical protein
VDPHDILAFVRRDWSRVADGKAEHWLSLKRGKTPTEMLTLAHRASDLALDIVLAGPGPG